MGGEGREPRLPQNRLPEGAPVTSGVQGLEGDVQGYSREAEGKAQPIQEADLVAQQVSCQQQSAHFLWAEEPEGDVSRSWPLCKEAIPGNSHRNSGAPPRPPGRQAGLQGTEVAPQAPRTRLPGTPSSLLRCNKRGLSQNSVPIENGKADPAVSTVTKESHPSRGSYRC